MTTRPIYRERLSVPWYWWFLGGGLAVSMFLVAMRFFHPIAALGVAAASGAVIAAGLLALGWTAIRVDHDGIRVGRGICEWQWIASAVALDAARSRAMLGPEADARAWLCSRPYLTRVVRVDLDDPADPHPYWLLGSRHPDRLAAAIQRGLDAR